MKTRLVARRARSAVLAVLLAAGTLTPMSASARVPAGTRVAITQLRGQVIAISTPNGSPTRFTIETADRDVTVRIAPAATFTALSAEAEVEGLRVGDYAIVRVRHPHDAWVALHITFDVRPIHIRGQVTIVATVIRETPNGRYLIVRLPSGAIRWIILGTQTKFRLYGALTSNPPLFAREELVHVTMRRIPRGWIAIEVDLLNGQAPQPR